MRKLIQKLNLPVALIAAALLAAPAAQAVSAAKADQVGENRQTWLKRHLRKAVPEMPKKLSSLLRTESEDPAVLLRA